MVCEDFQAASIQKDIQLRSPSDCLLYQSIVYLKMLPFYIDENVPFFLLGHLSCFFVL